MIIQYPFTDEDNYIFDAAKIEFVGGVAKLISQISGSDALAYWKLDETKGLVALDTTTNANHGAFQGGLDEVNRVSGKIGNAIQGVTSAQGFINISQQIILERTDAFSIEFWAPFTVGVVTSRIFISKQIGVSPFTGFSISYTSGKIAWTIRDDLSQVLSVITNNTYNDGLFHHIVCTYDGSSDISGLKIYVDDSLDYITNVNTGPLTSTITNTSDFQISGRDGNNSCIDNDTKIDEIVVYPREITAADVSIRWNGGAGTQTVPGAATAYPTDNPTIETKLKQKFTELLSFASTVSLTGLDDVRYSLVVNGTDKWWNGSIWTDSTGFSETNSIAEVVSNITSLTVSNITEIDLKRYLHSEDGSTTPELDLDQIEFNYIPEGVELNTATITGNVFDIDGTTSDLTIQVQTVKKVYGSSTIITSDLIPVTYDTDTGEFSIDLYYEDVEPSELRWYFNTTQIVTNFLTGINNFNDLTII